MESASDAVILCAPLDPAGLRAWGGLLPPLTLRASASSPDPGVRIRVGDVCPVPTAARDASGMLFQPSVDRISLWVSSLGVPDGALFGAVPPPVTVELRGSVGCHADVLWSVDWQPQSWGDSGRLFQFAGVHTQAFEVFCSFAAGAAPPPARDGVLRLAALLDRAGSVPSVAYGTNVGPTPVVLRAFAALPAGGVFDPDPVLDVSTRSARTGVLLIERKGGGVGSAVAIRPEVFASGVWRPASIDDGAVVKAPPDFTTEVGIARKNFAVGYDDAPYAISLRGASRVRVRAAEWGNPAAPGSVAIRMVHVL